MPNIELVLQLPRMEHQVMTALRTLAERTGNPSRIADPMLRLRSVEITAETKTDFAMIAGKVLNSTFI